MRLEKYPKFLEKFMKTKTIITTAVEDTENSGNGKILFYLNQPIELPEIIYEKTENGFIPILSLEEMEVTNDGNKSIVSSPLLKPGKEYVVKISYCYNMYSSIVYLYSYKEPLVMYKVEFNYLTPGMPRPPDNICIYKRSMHIPLDDMINDKNSILSLELSQDIDTFESLIEFKDGDWIEITDEFDDNFYGLDKLIEELFDINYNRCMIKFFVDIPTEPSEQTAA